MKVKFSRIIILFSGLLLVSCSNELKVNAPWKDIPIIYSVLDPSKDTHFVRIHKAFLGDKPVAEMASVPDSIYYSDLQAIVEEYINGQKTRSFPLQIHPNPPKLNEGIFTTDGFRLYYFTAQLQNNAQYKIIVSRPGQPDATATTDLVGTYRIVRPVTQQLNLSGRSTDFAWTRPDRATIFTWELDLFYLEQKVNNPLDTVTKVITYTFNHEPINFPQQLNYTFSTDQYFAFLAANFDSDPTVYRFFRRMRMRLVAGHETMAQFVRVNAPTGGIVQERPLFTNVENGVGLFTSSRTVVPSNINTGQEIIFDFDQGTQIRLFSDPVMCNKRFVRVTSVDSCICINGNIVCWQ